jgi:hypothetical protein
VQQLRLAWQWAFVFTDGAPVTRRLAWHHTEFGRRTDDERLHIVHQRGGGWELLNTAWDVIGTAPTIADAEQLAERLEARARLKEDRTR